MSTPLYPISVVLGLLVLSACSDTGIQVISNDGTPVTPADSDTQNPDSGGGIIPDVTGPITAIAADPSIAELPAGTRARAYAGSYEGSQGLFIIDDNDRLIGLVQDGNDSARTIRADINTDSQAATTLQQFTHATASNRNGFQLRPFAESSGPDKPVSSDAVLEVVDGQRIGSVSANLSLDLQAAGDDVALPVSNASLQGDWIGTYSLCDSDDQNCSQFALRFTIAGSNISGSSGLFASDGTDLLPSPVSGSLSQRGSVLDLSMKWNTYQYTGFAYVDATNTNQLMIVGTTDSQIADERMLASSLVRLQ